jgi:hypothetical protein
MNIHEPKKVKLWNKRHFEEKRTENVQRVKNIHYNPLNTELNPICHLLAFAAAPYIYDISTLRVKYYTKVLNTSPVCYVMYVKINAGPSGRAV